MLGVYLLSLSEPEDPLDIFPTICNVTQLIYFWKNALHVSDGISTHHQEHIQLYLQYLVLVNRSCYLPYCGIFGAGLSVAWNLYRSVTYVTDRYNSHTTLRPTKTLPQYRQVAGTVNKYQIL
jgi:hypothetical protein